MPWETLNNECGSRRARRARGPEGRSVIHSLPGQLAQSDIHSLLLSTAANALYCTLVISGEIDQKKSRIRETLNLSTDADHRTDILFWGGDGKKKTKIKKIHVTCDM